MNHPVWHDDSNVQCTVDVIFSYTTANGMSNLICNAVNRLFMHWMNTWIEWNLDRIIIFRQQCRINRQPWSLFLTVMIVSFNIAMTGVCWSMTMSCLPWHAIPGLLASTVASPVRSLDGFRKYQVQWVGKRNGRRVGAYIAGIVSAILLRNMNLFTTKKKSIWSVQRATNEWYRLRAW